MSTLHQINEKARDVLRTALGPVDYTRYQQQFSSGSGDYTAMHQLAEQAAVSVISEHVAKLKEAGRISPPPAARLVE